MPGQTPPPVVGFGTHTAAIGELVASVYAAGSGATRSGHPDDPSPGVPSIPALMDRLATRGLTGVVSVDAGSLTALVQGRCPLARVVATLVHRGLMPLTTPAPAARTLGGAITRESVGSSSFATGTFAASVTELHLLTPSGAIVAASPSGPHADLFHRIVGREGPSECFIVAARIRLVQAEDFVVTRTVGLPNARDLAAALAVIAHEATWEGQPVQFVEATVRANTYTIALGRAVTGAEAPLHAVSPSHYDRGGPPYAATLSPGASDLLTMTDYLQRWEPDGFWRSFHYGLAHRGVRRAWPARLRTPSVYARLDALMDSPNPAQLLERLARWQPGAPRVFREVAVPLAALGELLESLNGIVREVPLWVTPFATHGDDAGPIPSADPTFWAYCGIWGPGAHQRTGHNVGAENAIDRLTAALGGRTVRFGG